MVSEKKFNKSLGRLLKSKRKSMRISQEEMGKCLKIHQSAVCRVELGVQKLSVYQILVVSKKFDISPQVLIELTLAGCRR